jgi:hypothetical protein
MDERLGRLTRRWRERRDARRPADDDRPPADLDREATAMLAFPYQELTPEEYVDRHGDDMIGYTYDEARYSDAELDEWLLEVGRLLRERRTP